MLLTDIVDRSTVIVGGKGGVGKTTLASAIALHAGQQGQRTLIVSTDPAHNLGHLWERDVSDRPTPVGPSVDAMELDPDAAVEEHLHRVGDTMRSMLPERLRGDVARQLDQARRSPGMHEAALLERVAAIADTRQEYSLVVFDTAPSGHTARLMSLPAAMSSWTSGLLDRQGRSERMHAAGARLADPEDDSPGPFSGMRRDRRRERDRALRQVLEARRLRFESMRTMVTDHQRTSFVIALAAERLPVLETVQLHRQLCEAGVPIGPLVVNRRSPRDQGAMLAQRRAREDEHLATLRAALPDAELIEVPWVADDVVGEASLSRFVELLRSGGTAEGAGAGGAD